MSFYVIAHSAYLSIFYLSYRFLPDNFMFGFGLTIVGDQVVAMTASWGDRMWEVIRNSFFISFPPPFLHKLLTYSICFSICHSTPLSFNRFSNSILIQSTDQFTIHQVNSVESFVVGVKMRTDTQLSFQVRRMVPLEVRTHVLTGIHVYNLSLAYD
jgi:hypothetical protein